MHKKNKGFTLIEMMIVVAIIAILAAISYPSYQSYVRKTKRLEAQSMLMDIANKLQRYKVVNSTFRPNNVAITLEAVGYKVSSNGALSIPEGAKPTYRISLQEVTDSGWLLVAMTENGQKGDGTLGLDHRGHRCWAKGDDRGRCTPNSATNWDGK
ncbi:Fimbrial protein precursor [compost metagenome]|jgi:type IV pilus assembly protein PilE